jgi:hypothetical protein
VEELLRLYHGLSQRQREQLLAVLRAMAAALAGDPEAEVPSGRSR